MHPHSEAFEKENTKDEPRIWDERRLKWLYSTGAERCCGAFGIYGSSWSDEYRLGIVVRYWKLRTAQGIDKFRALKKALLKQAERAQMDDDGAPDAEDFARLQALKDDALRCAKKVIETEDALAALSPFAPQPKDRPDTDAQNRRYPEREAGHEASRRLKQIEI